jgi:hypothetical protein
MSNARRVTAVGAVVFVLGLVGLPALWNNRSVILAFVREHLAVSALAVLLLGVIALAWEISRRLYYVRGQLATVKGELLRLQDSTDRKADIQQYHKLRELLPLDTVQFLRQHHFGDTFLRTQYDPLRRLARDHEEQDDQFFDADVEACRAELYQHIRSLVRSVNHYIAALPGPGGLFEGVEWYGIGSQQDHIENARRVSGKAELPAYYQERVDEMNRAATEVVVAYDKFVQTARQRLRV